MSDREGMAPGGHQGDALSALLDGELTGADERRARAHLAACPACSAELEAVGQARSWLRALPPVDPPLGFRRRVLEGPAPEAGSGEVARLRSRRAGLAALAAGAAASVALLGLVSPGEPPATPRVGQLIESHATAVGGGDPVSRLVPAGVPVSFRR